MAQQFERIVKTSNSKAAVKQLSDMKTNRLTAIQIAAISFAITSAIGISYLNRKPQLTLPEARTHQLLLDTYKAASRALLFPTLPPAPPSDNKQRKLKAKNRDNKR